MNEKCLPKLGKRQKVCFIICPSWASTKKSVLSFAQVGQAPKKPIWHLLRRCKHRKNRFAICTASASIRKTDLPFAPPVQAPKKTIWHLHRRCKHPKNRFGICTVGASTRKTNLAFAPYRDHRSPMNHSKIHTHNTPTHYD